MNQMIKFGLILSVICLAATLVLAVAYEVTKPKIDAQASREEQESLRQILPQADSFVRKNTGGVEYFEASSGGKLCGYCVKVTASGYGGFMRLIAGIDTDGTIEGISVLEHQETPGLGAKIKEPWFLQQFKGREAKDIELKKNIDAVTGATISSKAVTDAVRETVKRFLEQIDKGK